MSVGRLQIPDGFLHVCRHGHVTAPGWMGQRTDPQEPDATYGTNRPVRMCPRSTAINALTGNQGLCEEPLVLMILHPVLLAAHKLGGETAVAEVLAGLEIEWPPKPEAILWKVQISSI